MEEVTEANERVELANEDNCSESGEEDNCSAALEDSYPELKPMDMVKADGTTGGIQMVISQQANVMVRLVNMVDCKDLSSGANPRETGSSFMEFGEQAWNSNGEEDLGIHRALFVHDGWYRKELTKLTGELMQITNLDRTKVRRRRVDANEISEKGHGNQGSAFWTSLTNAKKTRSEDENESSVIPQETKTQKQSRSTHQFAEKETTSLRKQKKTLRKQEMQKWKNGIDAGGQRANAIEKNASILPGGDGSRKSRNCETIAAYGWGVYGIREHSVEYWANKHNSDVQIMPSGGNMDWAPEHARSNTRAEQTHILAAMIKLFETGINVLYSVDYTGDRQLQ